MFEVYRGGVADPLDSPAVWRYIAKDCLRAPEVTAVSKNSAKPIAEAEKPQIRQSILDALRELIH